MSVNAINVSLKEKDNCFTLLPGRTLFVVGHMSVNFISCIGEPYGFLYTKQESQQREEATDFLSTFALIHDVLSQVQHCVNAERKKDT